MAQIDHADGNGAEPASLDRPAMKNGSIVATIAVAPMMERTDRHCRYLLRLISPRTRLYTEMITAAALVQGWSSAPA